MCLYMHAADAPSDPPHPPAHYLHFRLRLSLYLGFPHTKISYQAYYVADRLLPSSYRRCD